MNMMVAATLLVKQTQRIDLSKYLWVEANSPSVNESYDVWWVGILNYSNRNRDKRILVDTFQRKNLGEHFVQKTTLNTCFTWIFDWIQALKIFLFCQNVELVTLYLSVCFRSFKNRHWHMKLILISVDRICKKCVETRFLTESDPNLILFLNSKYILWKPAFQATRNSRKLLKQV